MSDTIPAGTAVGNDDAVRTAHIANSFFLLPGLLSGIDDQPRMEAGMSSGALLGPSSSFGVDVGIDPNGDFFLRGRAAADQAPPKNTATDGQAATPFQGVPPVLLILGGVAALWVLSRVLK